MAASLQGGAGEPAFSRWGSLASSMWSCSSNMFVSRWWSASRSANDCLHSEAAWSALGLRACWMSSSCSSAALRLAMLTVSAFRASSS